YIARTLRKEAALSESDNSPAMKSKHNVMLKRVLLVIVVLTAAVVAFTIYANMTVVSLAEGHIFTEIQNVPHNRV
ncbi:hypothetical protein DK853_46315, partial [Klebsiella oxytoca]